MEQEVSRKEVKMTAPMANKMLKQYNTFVPQRSIIWAAIDQYADKMKKGTFRKENISLATNKQTGDIYITDGQHRLMAIATLNFPVSTFIVTYEYNTYQEILDSYNEFNNDLARTVKDMIKVQKHKFGVDHWNQSVGGWVVSYSQYIYAKSFSTGRGKPREDRAKSIGDRLPTGDFMHLVENTFLNKQDNKPFKTLSTAFCVMHSFEQYGLDIAIDFWEGVLSESDVVDGVVLSQDDPRRAFRRKIYHAYYDMSPKRWWNSANSGRRKVALLYQVAFNHYLKGNKIKNLILRKEVAFDWEPKVKVQR